MKKADFVSAVAEKSGESGAAVDRVLKAAWDTIGQVMEQKDSVSFIGFGTFGISERAERQGKNPATGAAITIAAKTVPRFTAGKALKDRANGQG
jgi:DNA-binding protein HU-beta